MPPSETAQHDAGAVQGQGRPKSEPQHPIDWNALRTRLFGAQSDFAPFDPEQTPERLRLRLRGSFDGSAASVLTTYEAASKSVNLDASGYGKPAAGKVSNVADEDSAGGRGQ